MRVQPEGSPVQGSGLGSAPEDIVFRRLGPLLAGVRRDLGASGTSLVVLRRLFFAASSLESFSILRLTVRSAGAGVVRVEARDRRLPRLGVVVARGSIFVGITATAFDFAVRDAR